VGGIHPSPIDEAHVTTTCTHKQLFGPRGGLIMCGRDYDGPAPRGNGSLADFLQRAVFPFSQGSPMFNAIAAKARALAFALTPEFRAVAEQIVQTAGAVADRMTALGHDLVSGGTDNHIVLVDLSHTKASGLVAERALEDCYILVNKNRVPGDTRPATVTSGIRIGTNIVAQRGMRMDDAAACAELINLVISSVQPLGDREYRLAQRTRDAVRDRVTELCGKYPIPGYPLPSIDFGIVPTTASTA
jgi:glycine hydroxymethyltransferase